MTLHAIPQPLVQPLQCQQEVARFASRREDAEATAARIRRNGVVDAMALIRAGRPLSAHAVLARSFTRQAEALGLHLHLRSTR